VPASIVWLVGAVLALTTWRRHPRVSQTALVACALLLLSEAVGSVAQFWLITQFSQLGWSEREFNRVMGLISLTRVAFSTVGYVLLLFAVFGWRATPRFPAGPVDEPFAEHTAVRPATLPGGETAIRPDGPRP
jgi:hypothetical protein